MDKWTEGNLRIEGPAGIGGDYAIIDESDLVIGEAYARVSNTNGGRPAELNARLWATAPAMAELLQDLKADLEDTSFYETKTWKAIVKAWEKYALGRINEVLAMLEGGTS